MKLTIKTIILISIFSLFTVMAVSALNEDDISAISDDISSLNEIQSELSSSSNTRSISRTINSAIKQLNDAISQEGQSCVSRLDTIFSKLDNAANMLKSRSCSNSKRKNCINDSDDAIAKLRNIVDDLRELAILDEDENGTPDICDSDPDGDGIAGKNDNCPLVNNPEQKDVDGNRIGDACDLFFCCEDSSLTFPLEKCERKTIKSCSEEGNVVIGCIPPLVKGKTSAGGPISSSPVLLNQVSNQNVINFGTGATPSMIVISTGFFPFNNSQALLMGFSDFNCDDLDITLTPPLGFPGGTFEIGPAANGSETGPRSMVQISGDMSFIITLNNFPFNTQGNDQLGLSLFTTQNQVFSNSPFNVLADLDFDGDCHSPLASSSGSGTNTSSGVVFNPFDDGGIMIIIPPSPFGETSSGSIVTSSSGGSSSGDFVAMRQEALGMSTVPVNMGGMAYMAGSYDCDDFAHDLGMELAMQGFDTTFTAIWRNNGMTGHAVTDVHPTSSSGIVFVEPQNGMIINLDENMDGMVDYRDGTHSDTTMLTEGMTEIEVYMDRDAAAMAGVPID